MTRTERSTHPRAIIRDRSESKTGLDKRVHKNGGGAHSWGTLADDVEWATEVLDDGDAAFEDNTPKVKRKSSKDAPKMERRMSDEEMNEARKLRQGVKTNAKVDLGSIARSSGAVSTSPKLGATHVPGDVTPPTSSSV